MRRWSSGGGLTAHSRITTVNTSRAAWHDGDESTRLALTADVSNVAAALLYAIVHFVPTHAVHGVTWVAGGGLLVVSAGFYIRLWQGAYPHPPPYFLISYWLNFLAGAGYLVTSFLYMWANLEVVVVWTNWIELGCLVLYNVAAWLDGAVWVTVAGGWRVMLPRKHWAVFRLGAWASLLSIVAAALYLWGECHRTTEPAVPAIVVADVIYVVDGVLWLVDTLAVDSSSNEE